MVLLVKSWSPLESWTVVLIRNPESQYLKGLLNAEQTEMDKHHAPATCPTSVDCLGGYCLVEG